MSGIFSTHSNYIVLRFPLEKPQHCGDHTNGYVSSLSADDRLAGRSDVVRSSIWFKNGNIILVAAGSATFRIHRGQLKRHSEVFHDLFSVSQPTGQSLLEGCFLVDLHDCPSDVFCLPTALYDGL
jgi:hypothetical protein